MTEIIWTATFYNYPSVGETTTIPISNIGIDRATKKVNRATFKSPSYVPTVHYINGSTKLATIARIFCNGRMVFDYSRVIKCIDQGKSVFDVTIEEVASLLYNIPLQDGSNHNIVVKSKDKNGNKKTIKKLISDLIDGHIGGTSFILDSSHFTDMSGVGNLTYIPMLTDVPIPDLEFGNMSVLTAIKKLLTETLGLDMWYSIRNVSDYVYTANVNYGLSNGWAKIDINQPWVSCNIVESTELTPVNTVYVFNSDGKLYGQSSDALQTGTGKISAKYQINGTYNETDLNAFAAAILKDRREEHKSYRLKWGAGQGIFASDGKIFTEGALFTGLGDQSNPDANLRMEWRGNVNPSVTSPLPYSRFLADEKYWQIADIRITDQYTEITVGSNRLSIFDVYKEKLKEVDGMPIPTTDVKLESTKVTVPVGGTVPAYSFSMPSTTTSDSVTVTPEVVSEPITPRSTTTQSYTATAHPKTIAAGASYTYPIVITNLPMKYDNGNMVIQFDVSTPKAVTTDTHPFDLTISGVWTFDDGQSPPANIIQFDNGSSNLTKQMEGVTVVRRAMIAAMITNPVISKSNFNCVPNGKITITFKNNSGDAIKINDVANTLTFSYYKEDYQI